MEQLIQSVHLVDRFVVCDLENDRYRFYNLNGQMLYKPLGFYHDFQIQGFLESIRHWNHWKLWTS